MTKNRLNCITQLIELTVCLLLVLIVTPVLAGQGKVIWSESHVSIDVRKGDTVVHEIEFSVDRDMGQISIETAASINDIVSVNPQQFEVLDAGVLYPVQLVITPMTETLLGVHAGTIHFRSRNATIPDTLKIKINVKESEGYTSSGQVSLTGVAVDSFNATSDVIGFSLSGAVYSENLNDIQVYHQEWPMPDSDITCSSNLVTVAPRMMSGKNHFILVANDSEGKLIYGEFTLWAGNLALQGYAVDEDFQTVPNTDVTIKLGDDQSVMAHQITAADGLFSFSNLPARTVILEAATSILQRGTVAANGGQGFVYLPMRDFYPPSSIENNDFSLGLTGWEVGTAPVWLVSHEEESQSVRQLDTDLVLATSGEEGPQTISRTFNTSQGSRNVTVRYRFCTTEIPGGYFGSEYNDYFCVNIRSGSGGSIIENNTMNGLGSGEFDANGQTAWRDRSMAVNPNGDTVQVDLTVANVGDGLLDSYLIIDRIRETSLAITAIQLNDIDDNALAYLSASPHQYFNGNTRIHGTVMVEGAEDDTLDSLELEVIQNGQAVATTTLNPDVAPILLQLFGNDNRISIENSHLLFNLVPQGIDTANNGTLSLRARAHSQNGEEITRDLDAVQILRQFIGANRYGDRDEIQGGDDWAKPSVATFVDTWDNISWGDFSNMNAGPFPPHSSHRTGNDVDGWFNGYNIRNANTAATIINHLNQAGNRITMVYVTYQARAGNAFYDAIRQVTLNDGRFARAVIRPAAGHTTHFHWRITD